ncbi:hypothetical protein LZ32DRAFT_615610 [Colletotrichum eremochloae]|nr:hypothetical protein LZ32DRAFT_615610 [Colletotrichum eremochloae]
MSNATLGEKPEVVIGAARLYQILLGVFRRLLPGGVMSKVTQASGGDQGDKGIVDPRKHLMRLGACSATVYRNFKVGSVYTFNVETEFSLLNPKSDDEGAITGSLRVFTGSMISIVGQKPERVCNSIVSHASCPDTPQVHTESGASIVSRPTISSHSGGEVPIRLHAAVPPLGSDKTAKKWCNSATYMSRTMSN